MKVIVVGGTAAGLSAASKAKRSDPKLMITVYEKTGFTSYGSCGLPYFIEDKIKQPQELISLSVEDLNEKRGIMTFIHHEVIGLDIKEKTVDVKNLKTGEVFKDHFDQLVIATGSRSVLPPISGIHAEGVYTLKSVEDGIQIKQACEKASRVVIVGGGLIGLEMADALTSRGLKVSVIEAMPRLMPYFEEEYSAQIAGKLKDKGVTLYSGVSVEGVVQQDGRFIGCKLSNGETLNADMMVVSAGVKPNTEFAIEAGLAAGTRNTIAVNERMQTSVSYIYACGDCVSTRHLITGKEVYIPLGTTANKQGRVAGDNLVGNEATFDGVLGSQATKVFDLYLAATGLNLKQALDEGFKADSVRIQKGSLASYYPGGSLLTLTLVFDKMGGRLLGAQASGDASVAGRVNALVAGISKGMTVDELAELDLVYTPSVAPVYDALLIAAQQAQKKVVNPS